MDMNVYEHKKDFQIKYCETDFKDELKLSATLAYFEEVAGSSADELGFGYHFLKPNGYAFMVSGVCVEFYEKMEQGDIVKVCTWPNPPSYAVFGREYEIRSTDERRTLCKGTSRWCLVNLSDGKILPSKTIENQDYSTYNTSRALDWKQWKIAPFPLDEGELRFSLVIANSEYDHNYHVNNTRYADYALNCFSIAELSKLSLKRFQISYHKQCKEGDALRFYRKETERGHYVVLGVNQNQEIVVSTEFVFGDNA